MSWVNKIFSTNKDMPATVKTFGPGQFFYPIQTAGSIDWEDKQYLKHFLEVPEVAAVISKKAAAFANMRLDVVSKATGQPVPNSNPIAKRLRNPNYFQSQKEFLQQTKLFQEIFGNEIMYLFQPEGFTNRISGMFTLPPVFIEIDEPSSQDEFFLRSDYSEKVKYWINWGSGRVDLPNDKIIHVNNANIDLRSDDVFWGESKMKALSMPIANLRAAYEARNVLIENRGALGILSNNATDGIGSTLPLDQKEKEKVQSEWKKYGVQKNQMQAIITSMNLKWQQISIDADKLQLFEETKHDAEKICDAYNYPFELLANQKGVTFDNKKEARKELYENAIIPEAQEWVNALNRKFETEDKTWEIQGTFEHLHVFRENQKERAQTVTLLTNALSKAFQDGAISLQQYQQELLKMKIGDK